MVECALCLCHLAVGPSIFFGRDDNGLGLNGTRPAPIRGGFGSELVGYGVGMVSGDCPELGFVAHLGFGCAKPTPLLF